ncbi:MAG TPA: hypothetical protein VGA04_34625 [Streptosporangiaceae bacterium]
MTARRSRQPGPRSKAPAAGDDLARHAAPAGRHGTALGALTGRPVTRPGVALLVTGGLAVARAAGRGGTGVQPLRRAYHPRSSRVPAHGREQAEP